MTTDAPLRPLYRLDVPRSALLEKPAADVPQTSEILYGEALRIDARDGDWVRATNLTDGHAGWMPALTPVTAGAPAPTHCVRAVRSNVHPGPHFRAMPAHALSWGSLVAVSGEEDGWCAIGEDAWVFAKHLRPAGDPLDDESQQGTMINHAQFEKSMRYIDIAKQEGATVVTGGGRPAGEQFQQGYFVAPTVLSDVVPSSTIAQEEVFGPVMSVIPFDSEAEAVEIANGVEYGLTASVWTNDLGRALRVTEDFEAGYIWVNNSSIHFPGTPYGGVKRSGVGGKAVCLEARSSSPAGVVVGVG